MKFAIVCMSVICFVGFAGCRQSGNGSSQSLKQATTTADYVQPDPLPGESMDQWAKRSGAFAGNHKDLGNGLAVIAYKRSADGKCVFPSSGYVKWNADGSHVLLVDQEYEKGVATTFTYAPWVGRKNGEVISYPEVEFAPGTASINVNHTLYWAPNKLLAGAAQIEGFKGVDLTTLGEPEQLEQQQTFGARWADSGGMAEATVNPAHQIVIPMKGQPLDACDSEYVDKWRDLWKPLTYPGSTVTKKTRIFLEFLTSESPEKVTAAYLKHFPSALRDASPGDALLILYSSDAYTTISPQSCAGCKGTKVTVSVIIDDLRLPASMGFR